MKSTGDEIMLQRHQPIQHRQWFILLGLLLLNLVIHLPFLLINSFGEQDAARLVINSLIASSQGRDFVYYNKEPVYSAPLYSEALRIGSKIGILNPSNTIGWMTIVSFLSSAVVTCMLFIFLYQLTGSTLIALSACLVLQLNPTFWDNSIYGFPSILAIAFLLISLVLFQMVINQGERKIKIALLIGFLIFFILAVTTKIDILLTTAIFCLPIWFSNLKKSNKIIITALLVGFILANLFIYTQFTKYLLFNQPSISFYDQWNDKFPIDLGYLFSKENIRIIFTATGLFSLPVACISIILLVRDRNYTSIIFWLLIASVPIVLFWGARIGNSARHNLYPIIFLAILLALPIGTHYRKQWAIILIVMCLINYFILSPNSSTIKPSGQLISSSILLKQRISGLVNEARSIARLSDAEIAIVGNGPTQPYYQFELLKKYGLQNLNVGFESPHNFFKMDFSNEEHKQSFVWIYSIPDLTEIVQLADLGYKVVIFDSNTQEALNHITSMKGRFISISELLQ